MAFPAYFDLEGVPARQMSRERRPEVYRGDGNWDTYADLARFLGAAQPIPKDAFDALVRAFDAEHHATAAAS